MDCAIRATISSAKVTSGAENKPHSERPMRSATLVFVANLRMLGPLRRISVLNFANTAPQILECVASAVLCEGLGAAKSLTSGAPAIQGIASETKGSQIASLHKLEHF